MAGEIDVNGPERAIDFNEIGTAPDAPGKPSAPATGRGKLYIDGGIPTYQNPAGQEFSLLQIQDVDIINGAGVQLEIGDPLYAISFDINTQVVTVGLARADDSTKLAFALCNEVIAIAGSGKAIREGTVTGLDTSTASFKDEVFLDSTGGFVFSRPTGNVEIQVIGFVTLSDAVNGTIFVSVHLPNTTPNISQYSNHIGDANSHPIELKNNIHATQDPSSNNDDSQGYSVFSIWVNSSRKSAFFCADASTGAAIWRPLTDPTAQIQVVLKDSSGTINVGETVYVKGYSVGQDVTTVELADATSSATMPAAGIALTSFTNSSIGIIVVSGLITGINTSPFSEGETLYIDTTPGAVVNSRPTGTAVVQEFALVTRSNPSNGSILVYRVGANNLPNLALDNVWIGDASAHPAETTMSALGAKLDHTDLQNIGTNSHAQIDTHIADSTLHFTEASIDHVNILNIGTNSHAQIDSHIANTSNPHSVAYSDLGTAPIANGGTGQTTQTAAFDALAPSTTKGDLIVHNGTDNIRLAVGTNGQVPQADSAEASGIKWIDLASIFRDYVYFADMLENPVNADWTVNALANGATDSNNNALVVRRFDDTTEEGIGLSVFIPDGATNIVFNFRSRAETTPGATVAVIPKIYAREFPDNAAVESWTAGTNLTALSIPNNEFWQYDTQEIALSTLSLVAGRVAQFELTRVGTDVGDTLSGDWTLLSWQVKFS